MILRPRTIARFAVLAVAPFVLTACGGLGSILGQTGSYQGTWSGSATGNGNTGSMNLTVDENNNVTGTDTLSKPGFTCQDTGSISSNGNLTMVTAYNGTNVANISAALIVSGSNMSSTSGTISVIGGSSTSFSLNLNTNTVLIKK